MLGRLVQGLDLGDEEELVAAGHGHAQDQLEEPGHHSSQYFANYHFSARYFIFNPDEYYFSAKY